jgi:hypothetical protein
MYSGKVAVLTSKHEKLPLIAPAFETHLGMKVLETALDTDQLGTFSGEIPRTGTPLDTAIAKARLGMRASGSPLGLASEGSIGPDPLVPFAVSNVELVVFVDDERGIIVYEPYRSFDITHATTISSTGDDLQDYLEKVGFPEQKLIVRPSSGTGEIAKGIGELSALQQAVRKAASASSDGLAQIECDYRAMNSPSRRLNIAKAAELVAIRLTQVCSECQSPGFGKVIYERGLNCEGCGEFDADAITAELKACISCDHTELGQLIALTLAPAKCQNCNP